MTTIDRRAFLRRLGFGTVSAAAAAIGVFDVERLLWVPGEKTIVLLPPVRELHGFEMVDWVTKEMLRVAGNRLRIAELADREYVIAARQSDTTFITAMTWPR
jgi:hypothetical protein